MSYFSHQFLPKLSLTRHDSDLGRKYTTPEGNTYDSVTTFLGKFNNEYIQEWKERVGEVNAARVSQRASDRGTEYHSMVERYILNHQVDRSPNFLADSLYRGSLCEINNISNIRALEYPLYSDVLKLAGTVDCVADYKGELSLIDFKTSTKPKEVWDISSYFLQTTIYSLMLLERYKLNVPKLVIMIAVEFSRPQIFIDDRRNWIKPLGELMYGTKT